MTHPLGTMAAPTRADRRRAIVTAVWDAREAAGDIERALLLTPDGSEPEKLEALQATRDAVWATARASLQDESGPRECQAASALELAGHHLHSAGAHLRAHLAYLNLRDPPAPLPAAKLAESCSKEREFAARASGTGRRTIQVALSLLVEAWPDSITHED